MDSYHIIDNTSRQKRMSERYFQQLLLPADSAAFDMLLRQKRQRYGRTVRRLQIISPTLKGLSAHKVADFCEAIIRTLNKQNVFAPIRHRYFLLK